MSQIFVLGLICIFQNFRPLILKRDNLCQCISEIIHNQETDMWYNGEAIKANASEMYM